MAEWVGPGPTAGSGEVLLPHSWQEEEERLRGVASLRQVKFLALRDRLAAWLLQNPTPTPSLVALARRTIRSGRDQEAPTDAAVVASLIQSLPEWRSSARLSRLAALWRAAPPEDGESMVAALEAWRVQDRHLGEWVAQARDQMTRRRREVYRTVASRLAAAYGTVIVEKFELPRLGREPSRETEADYQQDAGRALARMAAPGGLRHALTQAAVREGGRVLTVPAEGTTRVHAPCDTWLEADFAVSRSVWCDGCGTMFDQDFNAAENLLRLATGEVTEMRRPAA
jgi:hypothetical protein